MTRKPFRERTPSNDATTRNSQVNNSKTNQIDDNNNTYKSNTDVLNDAGVSIDDLAKKLPEEIRDDENTLEDLLEEINSFDEASLKKVPSSSKGILGGLEEHLASAIDDNPIDKTYLSGHPRFTINQDRAIVIDTKQSGQDDGLNKCPNCGASDVRLIEGTDTFICSFCRTKWKPDLINSQENLNLNKHYIGQGIKDLPNDERDQETSVLKCQGCGAEIMIPNDSKGFIRCHWCRQQLTKHDFMFNGLTPDFILPFIITRDEAIECIKDFANKRRKFANTRFLKDFNPEDVMPMFMPYASVDLNLSGAVTGDGEHITKQYKSNDTTYYKYDTYDLWASVDIQVDDLLIEASEFRANINTLENTNNIINAVLPFDFKNAVKFDARYLKGTTIENRNLNLDSLCVEVQNQALTIVRAKSLEEDKAKFFNRGVRWDEEYCKIYGSRWFSFLAPIWLYAYTDKKDLVHYIAVNGRTKETMGSIPVSWPRMISAAAATFIGTAAVCWPLATKLLFFY